MDQTKTTNNMKLLTDGSTGKEFLECHYTLSGITSKVVAKHAEIARSSPGLTEAVPIYMYCALVALTGYFPVKYGG